MKSKKINKKIIMEAMNLKFDFEGTEVTIREYLKELLIKVWKEGESFSGKRPFGNSGWEQDLYRPLALAGYIEAYIEEEDGYTEIDITDESAAHDFVLQLIERGFV